VNQPLPEFGSAATRRFQRAVGDAISRHEFSIAVQPIVNLETGESVAWEALARWDHRVWGPIPPTMFIGAAERAAAIGAIDGWVLDQACRWRAHSGASGVIGVNVSPSALREPGFATTTLAVIRSYRLPPEAVCLEITESMAFRHHDESVRTIERLAEAGVWIALDDLGVGHASMSALSGLPVKVVKLDRSVAAGVGHDAEAEALAARVIAGCRLRGRRVVAEGIETPAQAEFFRQLGCAWGQGFHFGRPERVAERATA
jgi:EAL domain-containing protein (putative c-di-GMP-specific phosphodiesterase class I)